MQQKPSASTTALTFGALVVGGAVVGAAAALLLAPKSGKLLRGDIQKGAQQLSEGVSSRAHSAVEAVQRKMGRGSVGNGIANNLEEMAAAVDERT
ncbi:MAG: YtxH domain-containing protein [Deltaproteobacteria bacterium]|nr:YtxH domain-containing protein [Deltaproteobacteria bacterium]